MSAQASSTPRLYVATRKGLFILSPARGGSWGVAGTAFLGEPVTMVLPDPRDGSLLAALRLGHFGVKLHRSGDGGASWEECEVPAYPEKPAAAEDDPHPWSVDQVWALEAGGPDEPGVVWAGTIPGGLFRSGDGGATWQLVTSLWDRPERREWFGGGYDQPGIHSICVDPRDSRRLLVGVSCGGVWLTEDGGTSWQLHCQGMVAEYMPPERREDPTIQDPHRLAQCTAAPDHLWASHHNGVYASDDGGASWRDVATVRPSTFGFAAVVHPRDPRTAWFVPAVKDECRIPVDGKVVVARTRDGGGSFQVLTQGLPQEHAYDLVYRHALAVDAGGDTLAMGSTTGSLWLTEDQGDHWRALSHHLPPIYCVRFHPGG